MGRTRWPVVAPPRLCSHEWSISRSWKARAFSIAIPKLSSSSGESAPRARSISCRGIRSGSGRTPSKRSVYSRRASSPLARTSSTIRRAVSRTFSERNPPGRRSSPTTSRGSLPRASIFSTNGLPASVHGGREGGYLAVAQAVGAAVGDQARGRRRDLVQHHEVVLAQRRARGGEVHDAISEADEGGQFYGAEELYHLGLAAHPLEVTARRVRELGGNAHDLRVADGSSHILRPRFWCGQDHAARPCPEVPELHHVRPLLL